MVPALQFDNAKKQQEDLNRYIDNMPSKFDEVLVERNVKLRPKFAIIREAIQNAKTKLELQKKKIAKMKHDHDNNEFFLEFLASVDTAQSHLDMFTALADRFSEKVNFRMRNMNKSQEIITSRKATLKAKMLDNHQLFAAIRKSKKDLALIRFRRKLGSNLTLPQNIPIKRSLAILPISKITQRKSKAQSDINSESNRKLVPGQPNIEISLPTSRILAEVRKGFRTVRNEKSQDNSQNMKPVVALHSSAILITEMVDYSPSKNISTRFHSERNSSEGRNSTDTEELRVQRELRHFSKETAQFKQNLSCVASQFVSMASLFKECLEVYENHLIKTQQTSSSAKGLKGSLLFSLTNSKKKETLFYGGPTLNTIQNFYKNARRPIQLHSEAELSGILEKLQTRIRKASSSPMQAYTDPLSHLKRKHVEEFTPLQLFGLLRIQKDLHKDFRESFAKKQKVMEQLIKIFNQMKREPF